MRIPSLNSRFLFVIQMKEFAFPQNLSSKFNLLYFFLLAITEKFIFNFKETTSITLAWAFAYLLNHPLVIKKVHAELNDVIGVGNSRFITNADRALLPYMNAVINVSHIFWRYFFQLE